MNCTLMNFIACELYINQKKKKDMKTKCHVRSWIGAWNNKVTFLKNHIVLREKKKPSIKPITQYQLYNSKINANTQKYVF